MSDTVIGILGLLIPLAICVGLPLYYVLTRKQRAAKKAAAQSAEKAKWFCTNCESNALPRQPLRGSGWITILLSFFGLVPGLIYFIWRRTGPKNLCSVCHTTLIPASAPKALRILKEVGAVVNR